MQHNPILRRNLLLLLVASVLIMAISVAYFVLIYMNNTPVAFTKTLATNYISADNQIRDNKINYYNGNNFVQISLKDSSKKALTNFNFIEDANLAHWLANGAVFTFSSQPLGPELSNMVAKAQQQLLSKNISIDETNIQNIYWYVDFSDGSIDFLTYTDNPFGVSMDTENNTVYFAETKGADDYAYFGKIDNKGTITHNFYGSPLTTPTRIITQDGDDLFVAKANQKEEISVVSFSTKTFKETEIAQNIYGDSPNHTIYEELVVKDSNVYSILSSDEKHQLTAYDLVSKERNVILEADASSTVDYIGSGTYQITDNGKGVIRIRSVDMKGKETKQPVTLSPLHTPGAIRFHEGDIILFTRPYIYIKSDSLSTKPITDKPLEKVFSSKNSSLKRDIFNELGEVNRYYLLVPSGSLREEYDKLLVTLKENDIKREDVTIIPQLGNGADYDVN